MNRLEQLIQSDELSNTRIIVTGCGYRPLQDTFQDIVTNEPTHDSINVDNTEMKLNLGSAIAGVLAKSGATIHMVSKTPEKLRNIKNAFSKYINESQIEYSSVDLMNENEISQFVAKISKNKPIYWVQSAGLGAGSYKLANDNPYLSLKEIDVSLLEAESSIVLRSTHLMMQQLLPILETQKESKIALISSMSAIRGYSLGGTHCAAKGAIDRYANSASLGLYKNNIFITTVRPGGIDTGMYDNQIVQGAVKSISDEYKGQYREHFCLAPPTSVGKIINTVFTSSAHIPSINLVAKGQFPHEGS